MNWSDRFPVELPTRSDFKTMLINQLLRFWKKKKNSIISPRFFFPLFWMGLVKPTRHLMFVSLDDMGARVCIPLFKNEDGWLPNIDARAQTKMDLQPGTRIEEAVTASAETLLGQRYNLPSRTWKWHDLWSDTPGQGQSPNIISIEIFESSCQAKSFQNLWKKVSERANL